MCILFNERQNYTLKKSLTENGLNNALKCLNCKSFSVSTAATGVSWRVSDIPRKQYLLNKVTVC
jgi:hypothetical protein